MSKRKTKASGATDISCLYHITTECLCIHVCDTPAKLIARLEHQIRLDEILLKIDTDEAERAARRTFINENRRRLARALDNRV